MIFHNNDELINFISDTTIALDAINNDFQSDLLEKVSNCLDECSEIIEEYKEIIEEYKEIKFKLSRCKTLKDFNKLQEEYD